MPKRKASRTLLVILGDQLSTRTKAFQALDPSQDAIWMAEVSEESTQAWSSKQRTALFLSAMRHFAAELRDQGYAVHYHRLERPGAFPSFAEALAAHLEGSPPTQVQLTRPGEFRVLQAMQKTCREAQVPLQLMEDDSFLSTPEDFARHASGRKQLRMEYFYREMRKRYQILIEDGDPTGGKWNFDASNRKAFGKNGPGSLFPRKRFPPDAITQEVLAVVDSHFPDHPGSTATFAWPVTRQDALAALKDFIDNELPDFGTYQDAMWTGHPFLSHSLLGSSLNLKLLDPLEVIEAATEAYRANKAAIESVEGFVRQILGWREYVRGVYWLHMPGYLERNELAAKEALPDFYWTGDTQMNCIRNVVTQTLKYGYAHHIQRLMVTGLYALLLGVDPKQVHQWYLAAYVDAVEWVELPNTLGMSQYADGGVMASKPYVATGKYIKRMSNYCDTCCYNPDLRTGEKACPFTVLYWDFLDRHRQSLKGNPRMSLQVRNLDRIEPSELSAIKATARSIRSPR